MGVRGLEKARVGRKYCISKGGDKLNSGGIKLEKSKEEVTVLSPKGTGNVPWGPAPGVKAAKSFEFREGEK